MLNTLKPNSKRSKNAMILISIMTSLDIISFASAYFQYDLLKVAGSGGMISQDAANSNDIRERVIACITLVMFIISAVTFIKWFRRAYFNLHLKVDVLSESESWAAVAWFVPFVNLFKPYAIMKELYEETKELLLKSGVADAEQLSTRWLWVWWTLWILNNILGQIVFRTSMHAESIDAMIEATVYGMISNLIGIPLGLVTIKVIHDYSKIEPLLSTVTGDKETPVQINIPE